MTSNSTWLSTTNYSVMSFTERMAVLRGITKDTDTTNWLEEDEFELLTHHERLVILSIYHELDSKGLYGDMDFWPRLAMRLNADPELEAINVHITSDIARDMVDWIYSLGTNLNTFEEQFFEDYGERYEDWCVPTIEEDEAANLVAEEDEVDDYDDGYFYYW